MGLPTGASAKRSTAGMPGALLAGTVKKKLGFPLTSIQAPRRRSPLSHRTRRVSLTWTKRRSISQRRSFGSSSTQSMYARSAGWGWRTIGRTRRGQQGTRRRRVLRAPLFLSRRLPERMPRPASPLRNERSNTSADLNKEFRLRASTSFPIQY
jgi:hypothetical protein